MPKVNPNKNPMLGNFLWWLAFSICLVGGVIIYLIQKDSIGVEVEEKRNLVLVLMVVGVGLTVICGTAKRWMRH